MRRPRPPTAGETHAWVVPAALLAPHAEALRALSGGGTPQRQVGRGFLKVILGSYFDAHPGEVEIERRCPACGGPHGPPVAGDLRISVSYTAGRVAYAFAVAPVGIDIERLNPDLPWRAAAAAVLAPDALERVHRASSHDRPVAFLRAWTRREAVGKLTGDGLLDAPGAALDRSIPTLALPLPGPYVATIAFTTSRLVLRSLTAALRDLLP